jgi:hypothetical protein
MVLAGSVLKLLSHRNASQIAVGAGLREFDRKREVKKATMLKLNR